MFNGDCWGVINDPDKKGVMRQGVGQALVLSRTTIKQNSIAFFGELHCNKGAMFCRTSSKLSGGGDELELVGGGGHGDK